MRKKIFFIVFFAFFIIFLKYNKIEAVQIPKVYIEGDISNITDKKDERRIFLKFQSEDLNFEKYAKIKVQGSSSLIYEKKNYTINLFEDENFEVKSKIDVGQGWGEQSKYNLKANWIDKTHARNIVSARIAGKIQKKYDVLNDLPNNGLIDGFPIEIYANNQFLGLYTWNIPKDAWMWNIDEHNLSHIALEGTWYTEYVNFKKPLDGFEGTGWDIEAGIPNEETVKNFNRLIRFINESSDEEFIRDFNLYLDRNATLNYLIMLYLIEGIDNTGKNMILLTYDNGNLWYPCLYDLDSTWGTWTDGSLDNSYEILPEDEVTNHSTNNLFLRMIKCMPDEIANRWFELRKDILSNDNILEEFDNFKSGISDDIYQKEQNRWKNIPGYEMEQIEDFVQFRLQYIDEIMKGRYTSNYIVIQNLFQKISETLRLFSII